MALAFDAANALNLLLPDGIHTDSNGNRWLNRGTDSSGEYVLERAPSDGTAVANDLAYDEASTIADWVTGATTADLDGAGYNVVANDGKFYILRTPTADVVYEYMHPDTWTQKPAPTVNGESTFLEYSGGTAHGKNIEFFPATERWSLPETVSDQGFSYGPTFPAAPTDPMIHFLHDFADPSVFPNGFFLYTAANGWVQKSPLNIGGSGGGSGTDTRIKSFPFSVDALILANGFITLPEDVVDVDAIQLWFRGNPAEYPGTDFTYDAASRQVRFPTLVGSLVVGDVGRVLYPGAA